MPEYEAFKAEVETAIATLDALRRFNCEDFGDTYKHIGTDISLLACECASEITGFDVTFCKMMNYKFRNAAALIAMERVS